MKTYKQFQEGLKTKLAIGGLLALPFAMQKIKDKFDPVQKLRDKTQTKKQIKYEKNSGTTQDDRYFYDPTVNRP